MIIRRIGTQFKGNGGSSKVMESELAVDMLVSGNKEKARISTIFMDEELITMTKIRKSVPYEVTKESGINHDRKL